MTDEKNVTAGTSEFQNWMAGCQKLITDAYTSNFSNLAIPQLKVEWGSKYARIHTGRGSFAFIALHDFTNASMGTVKAGDVLKSAGYKKPAKHARGNIFDQYGGLSEMTEYGPAYLK